MARSGRAVGRSKAVRVSRKLPAYLAVCTEIAFIQPTGDDRRLHEPAAGSIFHASLESRIAPIHAYPPKILPGRERRTEFVFLPVVVSYAYRPSKSTPGHMSDTATNVACHPAWQYTYTYARTSSTQDDLRISTLNSSCVRRHKLRSLCRQLGMPYWNWQRLYCKTLISITAGEWKD